MGELTGWKEMSLGDVARWLSGGTPRTSEPEYWGGNIPWIGSGSLKDFRIESSERMLTSLGAANGSRLVGPGTVIFVVRGMSLKTEFRVGITQREVAFGQDCKALVAKSVVSPIYLAYAIKSQTQYILGLVDEAGHGTGRLNTDQMQEILISIPPLPEQQAIAEVLGALDDKIAANRKLAETAEELAVALVGSRGGARVPLGSVVRHAKLSVDPTTLDVVRVRHYSLPAFDANGAPEEVEPIAIKSSKYLVENPSVLISKLNPRFPRVWNISDGHGPDALASTEFLVLEPETSTTSVLWSILRQPDFSTALQGKVAGTSGSHQRVRPADLLDTDVIDPGALPGEVADSVTALCLAAASARAENQTLATTRDTLLPALMSGRIRVKDVEREVATLF
ncbi:restriction endonuclease subunit S [Hoyosella sp. G463]|uniref:Restriction endonuclease subunit S n=1 Tax=Lolliginicoccus lacisalsi TaxID=2742202 RepID=A0A927PKJ4_9ACTN|nr:restriction endonuclease subunit S [Lolliginicoccus lacisalsi]MBD8505788.1 restriction endonuclease subunit S [Lolliginicoccus lacisalsi]